VFYARDGKGSTQLKEHIHHSVSQWCYSDIPLEDFLLKPAREWGLESIELLGEKDLGYS